FPARFASNRHTFTILVGSQPASRARLHASSPVNKFRRLSLHASSPVNKFRRLSLHASFQVGSKTAPTARGARAGSLPHVPAAQSFTRLIARHDRSSSVTQRLSAVS